MEKQKNLEIKRLILAKMLYLHGCSHASHKDTVSRMLTIHHFDNAIELALRCIATQQGIQQDKKQLYFEDLLERIRNVPLKEQMKGLHRVRNAVQHQGDIPSIEVVTKYRGYAEDFLRTICRDEFGVPYEELSLSTLIGKENLKKQMLEAEEAFGRGEFKVCIELCDEALMLATFDEAGIFQTAGILTGYWGASEELRLVLGQEYPEKYKDKDYFELVRELRGAILQLGQATTGMQFLDEHRMDFLKHRQIVENLGDISDEELKNKAQFSLNFVTSLILKWQEEGVLD